MNPKVDTFLGKAEKWQKEMELLRSIALDCGLTEALKWGVPCYTWYEKNVVIINPLKNYCALGFFKGQLLADTESILEKIGEVRGVRIIRFTNVREIVRLEPILKAYIYEAIEVETVGLKVPARKSLPPIPKELQQKLAASATFKKAFNALTPGRQRGYILYFSTAKQSKTRESRIEKCLPLILKGKGLND